MEWLVLLGGLAIVALITVATAYFVAQEFAFMAVDRSRLAARAAAGDAAASRALAITKRTSFMLSGAQLGITVTGLLVGYVAEPLIGGSLGTLLGGVGVPTAASVAAGAVLALAVSTIVQMLFGELFPKNLAIARPEHLALRLAPSTRWYLAIFGWLIRFFDRSSNQLLRLLRIEPVHDVEHAASARDLEEIVAESRGTGDLDPELSMMIDRILDFPSHDVEHAMVPRAQVDTVRGGETLGELRARMAADGHSRYPVLAAESDEIIGVVHLSDLLAADLPDDTPAARLARPAMLLPEVMPLVTAVQELMATRTHLACVVDEYGGFSGVLTMEDLAEELVGEITDEHDTGPRAAPVTGPDEQGAWVMAGIVHVDEVERALDVELPRGAYETIAGLVIAVYGDLPAAGTVVPIDLPPDPAELAHDGSPGPRSIVVTVLEVERHVPSRVRITIGAGAAP